MNFNQILATETTFPSVIFLDAMGTLFGLKRTVGDIYGDIAQEFAVSVDVNLLNKAFYQCFKDSAPLAFPDADHTDVPQLEKDWWFNLAKASFSKMDVIAQFKDFSQFFDTLYDYFASDKPWFVYEDVIPTLKNWQKKGISLGIISNFDSRLYQVLHYLELSDFFTSITLSSYTGFAKPHPQIFQTALSKHDILPHQGWHIGDSQGDDYEGAMQAGMKAFLVDNQRHYHH
jgi:putative hydrolase of the HAD superfamily